MEKVPDARYAVPRWVDDPPEAPEYDLAGRAVGRESVG